MDKTLVVALAMFLLTTLGWLLLLNLTLGNKQIDDRIETEATSSSTRWRDS